MGNAVLEKKFTLFEAADMQIINGWVATEILQFFVQCAMLGFELTNFSLQIRVLLFRHKVSSLALSPSVNGSLSRTTLGESIRPDRPQPPVL